MTVPFIDLSYQENVIREEREKRFADIISRTAFILGNDVELFEKNFAAYCGTEHAIGVANGTDALLLIYTALGIGAGDEVITIPTTFTASITPLMHLGAKPVFVDIDPATRNFDLDALEAAITPRTKAILPVHLYGALADMAPITALAEKHNLFVIEDACQAQGARYQGARAGSLGIAAAFSFYPGKNLGAYGDAGAVVTNDAVLADTIRKLRTHGGVRRYEHELLGFNSRLDALQAAVLDEKLKHLDSWNQMRRDAAAAFAAGLSDIPQLQLPVEQEGTEGVYHLYVIKVPEADRTPLMDFLKDRDIHAGIHYPEALHLLPPFASLGHGVGSFPYAEELVKGIVSLPMYPGMSSEQVQAVVAAVREYLHA